MVHGEEASLQKDTSVSNGIMGKPDASDDNSHANERNQDNPPETMRGNTIPNQKLQAQWKQRNNAIKENAQQRQEDKRSDTEYTKNAEQKDIDQLVSIHPEIPTEMEIYRKKQEAARGTNDGIFEKNRHNGAGE